MSGDSSTQPSGRLHERVPGGRVTVWFLLTASRRLVAAGLLAVVFVALVALGATDPVGLRTAMGTKDPIETAFQGFLTAIITGVTLVVTINQLVLSQELGAVGDQRERMEGSLAFRDDVADVLGRDVAPAEPSVFLAALAESAGERAESVAQVAGDAVDDERRERIEAYVDGLRESATSVAERLDGARFGTFEVVFAALAFDYSARLYEAQRLQGALEDGEAAEEVRGALDRVIEALELFGPAREHVKTLYFQWELIDLSRAVLYASVPSLVVVTAMILYVDTPASVPGATVGVDNLVWLASGAATVALLPFALLFAYILRIATVTKRTLAIGPFVLRAVDGAGNGGE